MNYFRSTAADLYKAASVEHNRHAGNISIAGVTRGSKSLKGRVYVLRRCRHLAVLNDFWITFTLVYFEIFNLPGVRVADCRNRCEIAWFG